jgi:hypothetical protein
MLIHTLMSDTYESLHRQYIDNWEHREIAKVRIKASLWRFKSLEGKYYVQTTDVPVVIDKAEHDPSLWGCLTTLIKANIRFWCCVES